MLNLPVREPVNIAGRHPPQRRAENLVRLLQGEPVGIRYSSERVVKPASI